MPSDHNNSCCYVIQKQLLSRFLYPNPVCLLSLTDGHTVGTTDETEQCFRNVMTVSWLMPVDNQANILLSINANRFTADKMSSLPCGSSFVLNVPSSDQQDLILQIGKCSGRTVDKFATLGIASCFPGWQEKMPVDANINSSMKANQMPSKKQLQSRERTLLAANTCAISCCVAHLVCTLVQCTDSRSVGFSDSNHILLSANIACAYVKSDYWNGKQFVSLHHPSSPLIPRQWRVCTHCSAPGRGTGAAA